LIDPVNTGGGQMIGSNSTTVPSNVQNTWIAQATDSNTVGGVVFGSDIPTAETEEQNQPVVVDYDIIHQHPGFDDDIGQALQDAAEGAGVKFDE
jgi:hypothetical protein